MKTREKRRKTCMKQQVNNYNYNKKDLTKGSAEKKKKKEMATKRPLPSCILISAHGDTNWRQHQLQKQMGRRGATTSAATLAIDSGATTEEIEYYGHLDNFAGVYAVMKAYFSGRMPTKGVRIEVTYGEETDMEGAKEVSRTLNVSEATLLFFLSSVSYPILFCSFFLGLLLKWCLLLAFRCGDSGRRDRNTND